MLNFVADEDFKSFLNSLLPKKARILSERWTVYRVIKFLLPTKSSPFICTQRQIYNSNSLRVRRFSTSIYRPYVYRSCFTASRKILAVPVKFEQFVSSSVHWRMRVCMLDRMIACTVTLQEQFTICGAIYRNADTRRLAREYHDIIIKLESFAAPGWSVLSLSPAHRRAPKVRIRFGDSTFRVPWFASIRPDLIAFFRILWLFVLSKNRRWIGVATSDLRASEYISSSAPNIA